MSVLSIMGNGRVYLTEINARALFCSTSLIIWLLLLFFWHDWCAESIGGKGFIPAPHPANNDGSGQVPGPGQRKGRVPTAIGKPEHALFEGQS